MSRATMGSSLTRHVVRRWSVRLLACASLLAAPAANAIDSGDIVVVSTKGEVHITVNGAPRKVSAGGVLELPATVRTGRDGNIEIRQGASSVNVGPETLLEFPALEKRGAPIDRIQQPRGNAFYNIGKREGRKLRVETPYLVAVIKGTQFNVAAQDETTTISLFEGLLEVRASDDSDVIDLKAGEIASRRRGEDSITTIRMDAGKAPAAPRAPGSGSNNRTPGPINPRIAPSDDGNESLLTDRVVNSAPLDLSVNTDLRASESPIDTSVTAANPADLGAPVAEVSTTVPVDVGADLVSADPGVSAAVDVAAGTTVDAGPLTAAVDTGASVDLGAGAVDTSVSTGVTAGATVDLPSGTVDVDAGVIVGASATQVEVNVGSDVAANAVAGTVNIGLEIAGAELDVGVDLGLDDDDNSGHGNSNGDDPDNSGHGNAGDNSGSSNSGSGNNNGAPVVDVGGLLDSLTRRSTKK